MVILVDTREQQPLAFGHPFITEVRSTKLDVGDYACEFKDGHRPPIVFERKSIGDLFGSIGGKGYSRFKKCIKRSQDNGITMFIIIEGTLTRTLKGYDKSSIKGVSLVYKLFTIWVKYGVQPIFCRDREEMSQYITNFYIACGKQYVNQKKEELKCHRKA